MQRKREIYIERRRRRRLKRMRCSIRLCNEIQHNSIEKKILAEHFNCMPYQLTQQLCPWSFICIILLTHFTIENWIEPRSFFFALVLCAGASPKQKTKRNNSQKWRALCLCVCCVCHIAVWCLYFIYLSLFLVVVWPRVRRFVKDKIKNWMVTIQMEWTKIGARTHTHTHVIRRKKTRAGRKRLCIWCNCNEKSKYSFTKSHSPNVMLYEILHAFYCWLCYILLPALSNRSHCDGVAHAYSAAFNAIPIRLSLSLSCARARAHAFVHKSHNRGNERRKSQWTTN